MIKSFGGASSVGTFYDAIATAMVAAAMAMVERRKDDYMKNVHAAGTLLSLLNDNEMKAFKKVVALKAIVLYDKIMDIKGADKLIIPPKSLN